MMFAAVVVGRGTIYRDRNAVQTYPATSVQVSRHEALAVVCLHGVVSQQGPPFKIGNIVGMSLIRLIGAVRGNTSGSCSTAKCRSRRWPSCRHRQAKLSTRQIAA
jgi:hypothetical protein